MRTNRAKLGRPVRKKSDPGESPLFVGSTERAFQVLHALDGRDRQMPLSAIAAQANLDRSATQRRPIRLRR